MPTTNPRHACCASPTSVGGGHARYEREFASLRWAPARDGEGPFIRLINNTEQPTSRRACSSSQALISTAGTAWTSDPAALRTGGLALAQQVERGRGDPSADRP